MLLNMENSIHINWFNYDCNFDFILSIISIQDCLVVFFNKIWLSTSINYYLTVRMLEYRM